MFFSGICHDISATRQLIAFHCFLASATHVAALGFFAAKCQVFAQFVSIVGQGCLCPQNIIVHPYCLYESMLFPSLFSLIPALNYKQIVEIFRSIIQRVLFIFRRKSSVSKNKLRLLKDTRPNLSFTCRRFDE